MPKTKVVPKTPDEAVKAAAAERETAIKKLDPKAIEIPKLVRDRTKFTIEGMSPLVVHRWTEKAKEEIRAKQQNRALPKRDAKDPVAEYQQSLYPIDAERELFGFPAVAMKKAMIGACRYARGIAMTQARGVLHVHGVPSRLTELVKVSADKVVEMHQVHELLPIISGPPVMREDPVRIGKGVNKVADLRYRGEFYPWFCEVPVSWMRGILTVQHVTNLLSLAGYAVGVCENRPEKQGDSWGTWRIVSSERLQAYRDNPDAYEPLDPLDADPADEEIIAELFHTQQPAA